MHGNILVLDNEMTSQQCSSEQVNFEEHCHVEQKLTIERKATNGDYF